MGLLGLDNVHMKSSKLFVLILLLGSLACGNDDFEVIEAEGTVVDTSTIIGLEECGFMIRIDGELFKPTYLNRQYEQDGLEVFLKAEFLNTRSTCSTLATGPQEIRIEQISPSN